METQMVQAEEAKDESRAPVGDFIALVGGFCAWLFPITLNWYTKPGEFVKGVKTVVGVLSFAAGVGVFAFAIVVLLGRFINPSFNLRRSPGWIYATGASVIFMACIVGLVVTPELAGGGTASINAGIAAELLASIGIAVGGLLKF